MDNDFWWVKWLGGAMIVLVIATLGGIGGGIAADLTGSTIWGSVFGGAPPGIFFAVISSRRWSR